MKKLFFLSITVLLLLTFVGCEETASEDIDPPSALVLTATTNGLGVNLAWTGSTTADIDGYNVYFNGTLLAEEITTTSYQHTAPGGLGNYEVVAVMDGTESDPAEASTNLVEGNSTSIYYLSDPSPDHPSGFGWNKTDGTGMAYSFNSTNYDVIDFVVDADMYIASPRTEVAEANITWFKNYSSYDAITEALAFSEDDYGSLVPGEINNAAVAALPDGSDIYFVKLEVNSISETDHNLTIRWGFQLIPNLRILN